MLHDKDYRALGHLVLSDPYGCTLGNQAPLTTSSSNSRVTGPEPTHQRRPLLGLWLNSLVLDPPLTAVPRIYFPARRGHTPQLLWSTNVINCHTQGQKGRWGTKSSGGNPSMETTYTPDQPAGLEEFSRAQCLLYHTGAWQGLLCSSPNSGQPCSSPLILSFLNPLTDTLTTSPKCLLTWPQPGSSTTLQNHALLVAKAAMPF